MLVRELIEKLQACPQDLRVITNGYEGGFVDIDTVGEPRTIALNVNKEWYYGPHEDDGDYHVKQGEEKGRVYERAQAIWIG